MPPDDAVASVRIRPGRPAEAPALGALLPRLADFDVPPDRHPRDLWAGDLALLEAWAEGRRDDIHVLAAELPAEGLRLAGMAMVRTTPEPLSGVPAAHLDVLAVARVAEGRGVGQALMAAAETHARSLGAQCMTLHVIETNRRARALYERCGFGAELIRYIKRF